ncbi:DivIVA domain-containing protein [Asanoa ferruginea]|uniref:Cell wall synthesis protein Wag31 n=1 Tax=Asanoa ferruginea TaxID=53367 RepID=A0A3D9ZVI8_9ACTN|nr:DivIVA domain-containing protein [Asanoa ferruginea]REG01202.1 DivIVA domain-containing protein [Asanoa ferruginea]GIF47088.1 cell wall synthesis protein Wag31 [Asanoa ferruginea]
MPLTPADVHNMAFKKTSIGKRGYDEEEVDAFLDDLEQALVGLIEENHQLRGRVARGGPAADQRPSADPRMSAELDMLSAQLDRVRHDKAMAEQAAHEMRGQLEQSRTRNGAMAADDQVSRVLTMAERTADQHLGDARREANALLADARSTAQRITEEALASSEALERDARKRHQEAIADIAASRDALLQEISDLDSLERQYRAALGTHVVSQLQQLEGRAKD